MRLPMVMAALALLCSPAAAEPIEPGHIRVIDGETIRAQGTTWRLVDFPPEPPLVTGGGLALKRTACSCRAGHRRDPQLQLWPAVRHVTRAWALH
jgi:hypothetical protein